MFRNRNCINTKTNAIRSLAPSPVLAKLCHYANADPCHRPLFYELKTRLLQQYAQFCGHDIQEIVNECHGGLDSMGDPRGCKGKQCRRCGGTGIYQRKWIRLQRWQWGKYTFHVPDGMTAIKPESVQIHGRIQHSNYGKASREAELWLYLLTMQLRSFWKVLRSSSYLSPGLWPMCRLQKIAMWASMKLSWRRCWCGKMFPTWGSGWCICKKCRQPKTVQEQDDCPF